MSSASFRAVSHILAKYSFVFLSLLLAECALLEPPLIEICFATFYNLNLLPYL